MEIGHKDVTDLPQLQDVINNRHAGRSSNLLVNVTDKGVVTYLAQGRVRYDTRVEDTFYAEFGPPAPKTH
ncbi:hypothetical protein [Deinococcus arcticus]|uniref:hypothetical protein n=1 Tax=Deinococcus arcticus TaxID=2136176 RepID=UPI0011B1E2CB|nr:hypothetical protein [Deinococcus arcticus]